MSSEISNAYYIVADGSGPGGLPDRMWLGLKSYNSSSCNPANNDAGGRGAIGAVLRVSPTDTDPVSGKLLTQEYPNGATIGGYYYSYQSWATPPCASDSALQPIDSAFATAGKAIVPATQYLTIPEQGIRIKLTASTEDASYSIGKTSTAGIPPYIGLSVHSLDAYLAVAQPKATLGLRRLVLFRKAKLIPWLVTYFMTPFPNTPQIGSQFYYASGSQYDCSEGNASTIYSHAKHDFINAYSTIEKIPN